MRDYHLQLVGPFQSHTKERSSPYSLPGQISPEQEKLRISRLPLDIAGSPSILLSDNNYLAPDPDPTPTRYKHCTFKHFVFISHNLHSRISLIHSPCFATQIADTALTPPPHRYYSTTPFLTFPPPVSSALANTHTHDVGRVHLRRSAEALVQERPFHRRPRQSLRCLRLRRRASVSPPPKHRAPHMPSN